MSKTVLITGASRGIGFHTARRFVEADNDVSTIVIWARASSDFEAASAELSKAASARNKKVISHSVDVGDLDALRQATEDVYRRIGNIDIVVNNAGYTNPVPIQQIEFDDFERTMSVNLYAPFLIIQGLLKLGNVFQVIVNLASTAGINGRSGWLTYSASKAAVINMSQVMREELAIYGTRVVCISPGRTATALRKVLAPDEDPATIMQPEHVAEVIETLASKVGSFLDSENLVVRI